MIRHMTQAAIERLHALQADAQRIANRDLSSPDGAAQRVGAAYAELAKRAGARCDRLIEWRGVRNARKMRGVPVVYLHATLRD